MYSEESFIICNYFRKKEQEKKKRNLLTAASYLAVRAYVGISNF